MPRTVRNNTNFEPRRVSSSVVSGRWFYLASTTLVEEEPHGPEAQTR